MTNRIIRASLFFPLFMFMAAPVAMASMIEYGAATTYDVTLKKLELCASGSAIDNTGSTAPTCVSPFVMGSNQQSFDIASVAAGADLGSYGSVTGVPAGTVYTYVRMTLSRTFSISGTLSPSGCISDSNDHSSSKTSAGYGIIGTGTAGAQTLVLADVLAYGSYPQQSDYWQNGLDLAGDDFTYMVPLTAPVTFTAAMPDVRIVFNTQTALSGNPVSMSSCMLYPNYPSITITITGGVTLS